MDAIIYAYTRADALNDGVLIDVTPTAREAGFVVPVAITQALMGDIETIPESLQGIADVSGRLWDSLWMGWLAITRNPDKDDDLFYQLHMPTTTKRLYWIKMVIGPGDAGEPVITLMRPDES
jgi:hypothetical protein